MQGKNLSKSSNDEHGYLEAFRALEHKLENMFNHLWHNPFKHDDEQGINIPIAFNTFPKVDIIDREKDLMVKAELPGIEKDDLDISITNNYLFIKAKSCHDSKVEDGDYLRQEMTRNEYYRSILLPANVDPNQVETHFKNGLLELTIAKLEDSYRRKIDVT